MYSKEKPLHEEVNFTWCGDNYTFIYPGELDQPLGIRINDETRYFRISHTCKWIWKTNKTSISGPDAHAIMNWARDQVVRPYDVPSMAARAADEAFEKIRPRKGQIFCKEYLEVFPHLANSIC